jgi:NAD/NADP transhydrogenase beta subunit
LKNRFSPVPGKSITPNTLIIHHSVFIHKTMELLKDLLDFLKTRKKFWLIPLLIILLFFGFLIVLSSGSAIAPFIYTLF